MSKRLNLDLPTFNGHYSTARETSSRVLGELREPTITHLSHGTCLTTAHKDVLAPTQSGQIKHALLPANNLCN